MDNLFSILISPADLAQHLNKKNWVILDCRHDLTNRDAGQQAFLQGHIPTAQFAHLDDDLSGCKVGADGVFRGRHPLPDRAAFIHKLRSWGINDDTQVIAYDAQGGIFAARCWWMLRWVGHVAVAVLDGGLPAWVAAEHEITTEVIDGATFGTISDNPPLVKLADVSDVQANLQSQQKTLLDARSPDRFCGKNETMDNMGGHIPGAKNRFFKDNLQLNGSFKSVDQLRTEFSVLVNDPQQAIMQCGSGVTACHNLLALELAGMSGAALYVGSWSEWCSDPSRPVCIGTEP